MIKVWAEHSSEELKGVKNVILPIGSMEQHGRHLPVGTDTLLVGGLVERLIGKETSEDFYVLPAISYGKSSEHNSFPGTITISARTIIALLEDICCSLARHGVENVLVLNGHGGNNGIIEGSLYDLHQEYGLNMYVVHNCAMLAKVGDERFDYPYSCHAGFAETSAMKYMYPGLQRLYDRVGGKTTGDGMVFFGESGIAWGWDTRDISPEGHIGDPTEANAKDGGDAVEKEISYILERLEMIIRRGNK